MHHLLAEIGLYPGQPPLLFILNKENGLSQKELAAKLKIKPATLTVMLGRMEKAGLVDRSQDEADQRISRVHITEQGREVYQSAAAVMRQLDAGMFIGFDEEERKILRLFLERIKVNLKEANEARKSS